MREGKLDEVPLKKAILVKLDDTKKIVQTIEVSVSTAAYGIVSEITADNITVTTGGRGGDEKSTTYALAREVKVQYRLPGGRTETKVVECKLADVVAKVAVALQLDDDLKVVQSIDLQLSAAAGTVQSIDAKKLTILIRPARGNDDLEFSIAKDAKVMIKGQPGTLDDVAVGAEAHLTLTPDRSRVLVLQAPPQRREE
jgi:hypothetical protein